MPTITYDSSPVDAAFKKALARLSVFPSANPNDIEVFDDRAVKLTFSDGTSTTAVCKDPDPFSLEVGIQVCILKKILENYGGYHKVIKSIVKLYNDKLKAKEDEATEKECVEKKRLKNALRRKKRKERKLKEEEERQVRIMTKALKAALENNGS